MNKYQEALDVVARYCSDAKQGITRYKDDEVGNELSLLKELIEKATPKKPTDKKPFIAGIYGFCPSCHSAVSEVGMENYCDHCGQRLDWSNDAE